MKELQAFCIAFVMLEADFKFMFAALASFFVSLCS